MIVRGHTARWCRVCDVPIGVSVCTDMFSVSGVYRERARSRQARIQFGVMSD